MLAILWNIASFVVALGILVAVHEWGHFIVARKCGVKVLRFSIGFGKPIYKRVTSTGMEFVIAAIPLGGYVQMLDGRTESLAPEQQKVAFNTQAVWKRFAIVAAGPGINFVFAAWVLMIMLMIGTDYSKPIIGEVKANSYAAQTGLEAGDELLQVGDNLTKDWQAVNLELMSHIGDDEISLVVRKQRGYQQTYQLNTQSWQFDPDKQDIFDSLGLLRFAPEASTTLYAIAPDSAAQRIGLQANDKILKLNGTLIQEWGQIVAYVEPRANQTLEIEVQRGEELLVLAGQIGEMSSNGSSKGYLGVVPLRENWPPEYILNNKLGPIDALGEGMQRTWRLMTLSVEMLGKFFTGDVSVKNLSGPISIAQGAGISASYGIVAFLGFLALISVNLGIINLLPLPMLDGGHLMYFTVEWITGKPVPEAIQEVGYRIGGVLLFMLMAVAIFNDILRIT